MTLAMAVDEDRSGKRKVAKFNFYEEEDNKLRNQKQNLGQNNLNKSPRRDNVV